jgi:cell wall-associated NlpC family hydrolase
MGLESLAAVQARIATIQQQVALASSAGQRLGANSGGTGGAFAALLAQYEGNTDLVTDLTSGRAGVTDVTGMLDGAFAPRATTTTPTLPAANDRVQRFVDLALAQNGKPYRMGAEVDLNDPTPDILDCSELVEWAAHQVDVTITDGSWLQYLDLKQRGALIPVEEAIRTPGALLFSFSEEPTPGGGRPSQAHVAISLGDGRTIEARGRDYGVGIFEAGDRFDYGGVIPELSS